MPTPSARVYPGAKLRLRASRAFLPTLRQYLQRSVSITLCTASCFSPRRFCDEVLEPTVAAQLLRIIQEALTNVRKPPRRSAVEVLIHLVGSRARVIVQDDGIGFDPASLLDGEVKSTGLGFLRERAEEVGGSVEISICPWPGNAGLDRSSVVKVQDKN